MWVGPGIAAQAVLYWESPGRKNCFYLFHVDVFLSHKQVSYFPPCISIDLVVLWQSSACGREGQQQQQQQQLGAGSEYPCTGHARTPATKHPSAQCALSQLWAKHPRPPVTLHPRGGHEASDGGEGGG